jgi:hypothetical protein
MNGEDYDNMRNMRESTEEDPNPVTGAVFHRFFKSFFYTFDANHSMQNFAVRKSNS